MLTFERVLQAYDDGEMTRSEFCIHALTVLASVPPETAERMLRRRPTDLDAFMACADDVLAGAELFTSCGQVVITEENRSAIERLRTYMQRAGQREDS